MAPRRAARFAAAFAALAAGALLLPGFASAAGTKRAVVSASGALIRGNGATGVVKIGTGIYEVDFGNNVQNCAYVATPGDTANFFVPGSIYATTAQRNGNRKGVFVEVINRVTNTLVDDPFHLSVYCGIGKLWGVFSSTGSKVRGENIVSSSEVGPGQYQVIFNKDVHKCVFTAGLGTIADGVSPPGTITVAGRLGNINGVFVQTLNSTGTSTDESFHLEVNCTKAQWWGVINGADGSTARGSHNETASHRLGTGQYEVDFNRNVSGSDGSGCVYIATVGVTTNGGQISTPVTITTATRGGNPDGVFVFIHDGAGNTIDEPFHLNVVCS
jgi:hypothetical protein